MQEAFAAGSGCYLKGMATDPIQAHRRARLKALIEDQPYAGNLSALGRALDYKDGVYVRQMRDGERPISEKTVRKIEDLPGRAGWFGLPPIGLSPTAIAIGAYYDSASPEERGLIARMIPVDIDLSESTEARYKHEGGVDTNFGDTLRDLPEPNKKKAEK